MKRVTKDEAAGPTTVNDQVRIVVEEHDGECDVSLAGTFDAAHLCGAVAEGLARRVNQFFPVEHIVDQALEQHFHLLDEELPRVRQMFTEDERAVLLVALTTIAVQCPVGYASSGAQLVSIIKQWGSEESFGREYPSLDTRRMVAKIRSLTPLALCSLWDHFDTVMGPVCAQRVADGEGTK